MTSEVYILLPVHNRRETTRRFVTCLVAQTYNNYHLVLIDDGSLDGTAQMVQEQIRSLTVIQGAGKWWWAGSLQQGYEWLRNQRLNPMDIVLIMNDDTEFDSDFLENGAAVISAHPNVLLLAQCYDQRNGELIDKGVHIDWRKWRMGGAQTPEEVNCFSTRGLFLHAADFLTLGGFYPRLLPHYLSDYEFTIRAHRRGMQLITDPTVKLRADLETTGYHSFEDCDLQLFLKRYFSIRSNANPIFRTSFMWLACPWPWKVINIARVWLSAARKIAAAVQLAVSPKKSLRG